MRLFELYRKSSDSVVIKYDGYNYRVPGKEDDNDEAAYYTADKDEATKEAKRIYGSSVVYKFKIADGEITEGIEL